MSYESAVSTSAFWTEPDRRVPRIALMGEFSAGKSTLANLMIGANPLPVQVVATQLPPVWMTYGAAPAVIVDLKGAETPCDIDTLQGVSPSDTAFIKYFSEEDILGQCDIIDMPGISDPNMSSAVWERVLPFADAVVWCTPAMQAWRQSEAAVWAGIDEDIRRKSILVVTRADMLLNEVDRNKVLKRVEAETRNLFAHVVMMSLTQAQSVEQNDALWAESGADVFVARFMEMVASIERDLSGQRADETHVTARGAGQITPPDARPVTPRRPTSKSRRVYPEQTSEPRSPDPATYMPKFS